MSCFVVVEGLDGAGTTTQTERLVTWLRAKGLTALQTREPTNGPVGQIIRSTLRGEEGAPARSTLPWMFAADRADHLRRTVEPALESGSWVVSDRYLHSSMAYQSLDLPLEQVYGLNASFRVPDLTLFIDVPVDACLARIQKRGEAREIFEQRALLTAIAQQYGEVLQRLGDRGDAIARIDGTQPMDAVAAAILEHIEPLLTP